MPNSRTRVTMLVVAVVVATVAIVHLPGPSVRDGEFSGATLGDPRALQATYERWKAAYDRTGGGARLLVPLAPTTGLSARVVPARGRAVLDLRDGSLSVTVNGLPHDQGFDVWLIGGRPGPGPTTRSERNEVRVGSLTRGVEAASLETRLPPSLIDGFALERIAVARAGEGPLEGGLLFGGPSLFQRVYHQDRRAQMAGVSAIPFSGLVPRPAYATSGDAVSWAALVAEGERLFFEETFNGNGRTCGTCHPAENNFTIDPAFIATLPFDDPLFVAEDPNLQLQQLEQPELMRGFGLILENVDGFDPPDALAATKFTMRGVPHTLGMVVSLTSFSFGGPAPLQATGWSGDGAPGLGSLREFATGAVIQHFPRTMNRNAGGDFPDFRLPTDHELDALEAFQLSRGRQEELDLATMTFRGAVLELGRSLFLDPTTGKCNICHKNAGANFDLALLGLSGLANLNFDTGVEAFEHPSDVNQARIPTRPCDGGFGRLEDPDAPGCFGDGSFNTPSLVEAADTPPFFHNNAVNTIEEAVEFYVSDAFNESPSGEFLRGGAPLEPRAIDLNEEEIRAVGAFLRGINALENIRSSIAFDERAAQATSLADARTLLQLSGFDIRDAIRVLQEASLHRQAVLELVVAQQLVERAGNLGNVTARRALIQQAIIHQRNARAEILVE